MTDIVGTVEMTELAGQIKLADEVLPNEGTANFLSWIRATIEEHGFAVVYSFDAEIKPEIYKGDEYTFIVRRNDD